MHESSQQFQKRGIFGTLVCGRPHVSDSFNGQKLHGAVHYSQAAKKRTVELRQPTQPTSNIIQNAGQPSHAIRALLDFCKRLKSSSLLFCSVLCQILLFLGNRHNLARSDQSWDPVPLMTMVSPATSHHTEIDSKAETHEVAACGNSGIGPRGVRRLPMEWLYHQCSPNVLLHFVGRQPCSITQAM